ncbi:G protein subunit beta [Malassezia cuniculi]|uniref:G protein subunit beta n=1 Tax=Malassezia cuniculi TaxID=948313 RepID=A0AAF0EW92_9BASI|nr:G protein subunit beta [Malassezia cuniculi]
MLELQERLGVLRAESDSLKLELQRRADRVSDTTLPAVAKDVAPLRSVPFKRKRALKMPSGKVHDIAWDPSGKNLMSASQDGHLIIWNAQNGHKVQAISLQLLWVTSCAYAPKAPVVASGGLDSVCSLYNLRSRQSLVSVPIAQSLIGHQGYISAIEFHGDSQVVTASGDSTCALWDVASGTRIRSFTRHTRDVCSISFESENVFISGGCDARAYVWDLRIGDAVQSFTVGRNDLNSLRSHPGGRAFATGSEDAVVRLFDLTAGCELAKYTGAGSSVTAVEFSQSGRLLFAGADDGKVAVWDALRAECITVFSTHDSHISKVRVSPDGRTLATGSWDAKVLIYGQ